MSKILFVLFAFISFSNAFAGELKVFGEAGVTGEIWGYPHRLERFIGVDFHYICKRDMSAKLYLSFRFIDDYNEETYTSFSANVSELTCNGRKKLVYKGIECSEKPSSACQIIKTVETIKKQKKYQLNLVVRFPDL